MTIRIGILGAARIAPAAMIVPARTNPEFEVVAVGARDRARAERFAAEHGIPHVADDYSDLVRRDDVDLVYVALPAAMHAEWSMAALSRGKAVLCEKPFAMSAREASEMVEASRRAQKPLIEAFHYRHHGVLRRAFAVASSGAVGRLIEAYAVFDVPIAHDPEELRWLAHLGGGALMDLGCYCVHALRTIAGGEPRIAKARIEIERGVDAVTEAELHFDSGLAARVRCAMTASAPNATLRIRGENGAIEIVNFVAPQIGCRFTLAIDGKTTVEPASGATTFEAQLAHVADVMLRGAEPLAGFQDAIGNMTAIDAIYSAAGYDRARYAAAR